MPVAVRLPDLRHWKAQVKCQAACPVETDAGRYVQLVAEGRPRDGYLVARALNPFASVCGRVCAAPCENACRRGAIDAPITMAGKAASVLRERFADAARGRGRADDSVEAGRAYVAAYAAFMHYVEELETLAAAPAHSTGRVPPR